MFFSNRFFFSNSLYHSISPDESNASENANQTNNHMQNAVESVNQQQQQPQLANNNLGMNSMAMPPRGMPRFHANNNNQRGDFSHVMRLPPPHRMNFGPPPPPPPPGYARMQQSRFRAQW